jgi:hypothetical protein
MGSRSDQTLALGAKTRPLLLLGAYSIGIQEGWGAHATKNISKESEQRSATGVKGNDREERLEKISGTHVYEDLEGNVQ